MSDAVEVFRLERPPGRETAVLVEVPHAGLGLPDDVRATLSVDAGALRRDADLYVDRLFRDASTVGATVLAANLSRYVVDLNRHHDDIDEWSVRGVRGRGGEFPRGVIWRETGDGRPALRSPLTREAWEARIARYYDPYHQALGDEVRALRTRHRHVLVLSAHSMPGWGRGPRGEPRVRRADVVPGTRGKTTADRALIDAVEQHFRAAGLSVRHDDPYRGGATTGRWGRPREGLHAIQIEVNRGLYLHEHTGDPKPEGMAFLTGLCGQLVERLGDVVAQRLG